MYAGCNKKTTLQIPVPESTASLLSMGLVYANKNHLSTIYFYFAGIY